MSCQYQSLSRELQPLEEDGKLQPLEDGKASEAPMMRIPKQIKELWMSILCLCDFISDIFAAQANAHSPHEELHILGYFGAALLLASALANFLMVAAIRKAYLEAFQQLNKRMPVQWHLFRLLSSTSPEILCGFFELAKVTGTLPVSTTLELEVAAGTVKRFGLVAQLFEDIPQFCVQALSIYISLQHGWTLSFSVLVSLGGTLVMVLFKTITNLLSLALKCQVSQVVLQEAAERENRHVKLWPGWTNAFHLSVQALLAIFNVAFLINSGPIHLPPSKYLGSLDGRTIGYISLFTSYALAIMLGFILVLRCRDCLWHMLLDLHRSSVLLILATLHPCVLLLAEPGLPGVAGCLWSLLVFPPLLRNITIGTLSLWGIWKEPFPVPENFCISLAVLNFLAILQLVAFVEDTADEEMRPVPPIASLENLEMQNMVETRKLEEIFGKCQESKLAEWPSLLKQCPPSFKKHEGISMAVDLWKAVERKDFEAVPEAANRLLASGHNFETLVMKELQELEHFSNRHLSQPKDWTTLPEMSMERQNCAAAAVGGIVYVMGGYDGSNRLKTVECFDTKTQCWTTGPETSSKRSGCAAAAVGDMVYVMGGYDGSNRLKTVESFDSKTQRWPRLPEMQFERSACAAAAVGDMVYVMGGHNGSNRLKTVECFDTKTQSWTTLPEMSSRRSGCAAAAVGDMVYVLGGCGDGNHLLKTVECFDTKTQSWTTLPEMQFERSDCAAAALGDMVYVMGGYDGSNRLSSVECLVPFPALVKLLLRPGLDAF